MSPKKRVTPSQTPHSLQYGLEISSRDPRTGAVTSVLCNFCRFFGREDKVGQKRSPTAVTKKFRIPFRPALYTQHHCGQHPAKWAEYQSLSDSDKVNFFGQVTPVVNTLHAHFVGSGDQLYFDIDAPIVDTIIRKLLFDPDEEHEKVERALSVFVPMTSGGDEPITRYRVHIKNMRVFKLVIGQVALGSSFRLASRQIAIVREELSLGYLSGCNEAIVSRFARVAAGACLQKIREILKRSWAFSVAFDSATVEATSYFDVRVRFMDGIRVHCFHLLCLPLYGSHTGELMFTIFKEAMHAVCPRWPDTLLSTGSDGARNMMGRDRGIVSRVAQCSTAAGHKLIRFWCAAHQLDLVIAKNVSAYCDETWYSTLVALIGFLRRQQNLVNEMRSRCPKVARTRWLSLGNVLPWLARHRVRILQYLQEKNPQCTPSVSWWISLLSARRLIDEVNILFKSLQYGSLLVSQQREAFTRFIGILHEKFLVTGPLSTKQIRVWNDEEGCRNGSFGILLSDVSLLYRGLGSTVASLYDGMLDNEQGKLCSAFGTLLVGIAEGVATIDPERDENNEAANEDLPPLLPKEFATMMPSSFVDVVIRFRSRLEKSFGQPYIDALEEEQYGLRDQFVRDEQFRSILESMTDDIGFHDAWVLVEPLYPKLCEFAGGLATIYPGSTRVESDFSIIDWEKNDCRTSLMDFSLEGIMHSKQFKAVHSI